MKLPRKKKKKFIKKYGKTNYRWLIGYLTAHEELKQLCRAIKLMATAGFNASEAAEGVRKALINLNTNP